jgi:hypothetical protein
MPFRDGNKNRRLDTALGDELRSFPQAGLEELAEARLGVFNWPRLHDDLFDASDCQSIRAAGTALLSPDGESEH